MRRSSACSVTSASSTSRREQLLLRSILESDVRADRSLYEAAVLRAFREVEDALVAFERQQVTRIRLEEAVRADERAAELARQLYTQGLTDFLNVLTAEETLFTAQDSLAQSERDVSLELIALYKALGGGWQVAGPVPAPAA